MGLGIQFDGLLDSQVKMSSRCLDEKLLSWAIKGRKARRYEGGWVRGCGQLGRALCELEGARLLGAVSRPYDLSHWVTGNQVQTEVPGWGKRSPCPSLRPTPLPRIPFNSEQPGPSASWPPGGTGPAAGGRGLSGRTPVAAVAPRPCVPSAWRSSLRAR